MRTQKVARDGCQDDETDLVLAWPAGRLGGAAPYRPPRMFRPGVPLIAG